jgi:hypothetical protein
MPDLRFEVAGVEPLRHSASPQLLFRLVVQQESLPHLPIEHVLLHAQIRIDPQNRNYDPPARERLEDLFGRGEQWGRTLQSMLWTHADAGIPRFEDRIVVGLPVPCTYDFNIAATRLFDGLSDGEAPLTFLFSGTIFHLDAERSLRVAPVSWDKEVSFRLPIRVWKELMELYYPGTTWLRVAREVFDRLQNYRRRSGAPTWERALEELLKSTEPGHLP